MSKPGLGRTLASLLDGETVANRNPDAAPGEESSRAMTPALAKLVEGEAPRQEPPAAVQPPTPTPSVLPSWYLLALDIILLVTAELLVAFGRGIPGWIKWPVVFACVIAGAACALWAVLQHHFPRRTPKDAALGRVVFR